MRTAFGSGIMKYLANRITISFIIILVIGMLAWLAREFGSMEWLLNNEQAMRQFVADYPLESWLLGLGIYTAFSIVPGTAGKSVVFGWLFGFWPAVLLVDLGLTVAAIASFVAARFLVRDLINRRFGKTIGKLDRLLEHDTAYYLLTMRLAHVPFSFVNYGAAATGARLTTFSWTTAVGILPGTIVFVLVGSCIPSLRVLVDDGMWQLLNPFLIALLVGTVVFPVLVRWAIAGYRSHEAGENALDWNELEAISE